MNEITLPSILNLFTLGVVFLIALFLFMRFLRKPQNRHPMEGKRERNIEEIRAEATAEKTGPIK